MYSAECKKELEAFLIQKPRDCRVTVLPDFFLDRLINLRWSPTEFFDLVADVAKRKGGSIDGIAQTDIRGGNAINVASALANLGATVTPIVCTNAQGLEQIKYSFKGLLIDTSHIKIQDKASTTTALEFKSGSEKTNVMIRDLGSLVNFGPDNLDELDYEQIEASDYTCVFNWAGTAKYGTILAQAVFARAKKSGYNKTYYDTADPTPNAPAIWDLMEKVLKSSQIDILAVNENEAIIYASLFDKTIEEKKQYLEFSELAMQAARVLSKRLQARIDLHTTAFSASLEGNAEAVAPSFKVKVLRATGAGDAWTAGNILGDRNSLSDECRLLLANAVSACYLSDPEGKHPTWSKLTKFLNENILA